MFSWQLGFSQMWGCTHSTIRWRQPTWRSFLGQTLCGLLMIHWEVSWEPWRAWTMPFSSWSRISRKSLRPSPRCGRARTLANLCSPQMTKMMKMAAMAPPMCWAVWTWPDESNPLFLACLLCKIRWEKEWEENQKTWKKHWKKKEVEETFWKLKRWKNETAEKMGGRPTPATQKQVTFQKKNRRKSHFWIISSPLHPPHPSTRFPPWVPDVKHHHCESWTVPAFNRSQLFTYRIKKWDFENNWTSHLPLWRRSCVDSEGSSWWFFNRMVQSERSKNPGTPLQEKKKEKRKKIHQNLWSYCNLIVIFSLN